MKITTVTCVKNEGPFLLEWIAFNRVIGVTDFLFYSNDCDDGTDTLLDGLAAAGVLTHLPNPAEGRNYQMEALKHSRKQDIVSDADWVWIADVDEFLNIRIGNGTIPELIEACGDPQAISLHFQFFASGSVEEFIDEPVIAQFCETHNPDIWCDEFAIEVKTLVRQDFPVQYYGAHRPFHNAKKVNTDPIWTDGSGGKVPGAFLQAANKRRIRRFPARGSRRFATLHHYALRSLDSYLVKNDRGDVNREHRAFDDSYWRERNDTALLDESILRYLPSLKAEIAWLRDLPGIGAQHDACAELHRQKIAKLRADPEFANLRVQLQQTPGISPAEAETIALFKEGLPAP